MEEATRIGNRSGKSSEDERREAEEKVNWIFHTRFLNICSGGEVRQVCEGGEGEAVHLLHAQQYPLGGKVVRFPDPLGKWVGRTNPLRAGNLTSEASGTENVD